MPIFLKERKKERNGQIEKNEKKYKTELKKKKNTRMGEWGERVGGLLAGT